MLTMCCPNSASMMRGWDKEYLVPVTYEDILGMYQGHTRDMLGHIRDKEYLVPVTYEDILGMYQGHIWDMLGHIRDKEYLVPVTY